MRKSVNFLISERINQNIFSINIAATNQIARTSK